MKRLFFTILISVFAFSAFAGATPWDIKLPFKNAVIKYEMSGSFKGTKELYIKDYGKTRAEYTDAVMSVFGIKQAQKEFTITTPDWIYTHSDEDTFITKQINPDKCFKKEYNKLSPSDRKKLIKNMEKSGISTVQALDGTVEKEAAKVLGYTCDKVTLMGITSYTISGTDIPLRSEGKMMTVKEDTKAVSLQKKTPPASKFKLPNGMTLNHSPEADAMTCQQISSSITSILDGGGKPLVQKNSEKGGSGVSMPKMSDEQKAKLKGMMNMFGGEK